MQESVLYVGTIDSGVRARIHRQANTLAPKKWHVASVYSSLPRTSARYAAQCGRLIKAQARYITEDDKRLCKLCLRTLQKEGRKMRDTKELRWFERCPACGMSRDRHCSGGWCRNCCDRTDDHDHGIS